MPMTKRRKTEQGEGNSSEKEKEKNRTTSDNKDAVKEDKQSKGDQKSDTNDRKHQQTGRQDSSQLPQETPPKVPRSGAVTRSRVVRKPKRDLSPPPSPTKKPAKETKTNTPETKQKRQWELWSVDDKDAFFDGLFEVGKDFDGIQTLIAQKSKKKGVTPALIKNKDQVRHFYYRTWHKISKFITLTQDVKKESQEIYGLINYGVLRKRIKGLNEKTGAKLNDLVHNGFTTVKIRGKNLRIKTPICLALKKLNNIDTTEHKCNAADRIPNKIHVEMNPKTNATWNMIQEMAFNPRLKLMLKPNRTLSSVITYLSQKWKSHRLKLKENVPGAETEPVPVLTVYPHPDCDITPLTLQATKEPKINITFSDYRENMQLMNSPVISKDKKGDFTSTKTSSTIFSENSHSVDFMDPKNGMFESPKSRGTVKDSKTGMTPSSTMSCSVYSNDAAFLSEGENAMFPDTPLSRNNSKSTENLTETDSTDGTPPRKKHLSGGAESEVVKSSDNEDKSEKEDQESLNVKEAFEKGWTSTSAENLTIAQLFLMIGKDNKIRLEYDFCKESTIEDIVKTQLTNTLRRLVHLAVMEMTDVKGSSSSSSPCHTCGAVRAKATKGCGVKGQRAVSKNPLSSRSGSGDGLVDAGTQTTLKLAEPINSSQGKEAVFKVPVAGTAFLQRNTLPPGSVPASRSLNQAFNVLNGSGYRSGRKIRQINRKPMVVQRTILPKAPNYFLVQPNGQNLKTVINVPNSIPILSNVSTAPPACTTVKTVQLDVQSHSQTQLTLNPSQLEVQSQLTPSQIHVQNHGSSQLNVQNLGPGQLNVLNPGPGQVNIRNPGPNQLSVQSPGPLQTIMMGPGHLPVKINHVNSNEITASSLEITAGTTVNIYTSAVTSHNDVITTSSTVQGSLSPPSISNLLDMSFSGFGTPGSDGEKLFEMALENGSSFEPMLDESANKETASDRTSNKTEPVKALFRSPVCTSSWMNGEVGDISFMSLLNETAKPDPVVSTATLQPQTFFFENSRDSSIMGKFDVDTLMNESSLDFVAKFADLQALTQEDPMADLTNSKKTISNG